MNSLDLIPAPIVAGLDALNGNIAEVHRTQVERDDAEQQLRHAQKALGEATRKQQAADNRYWYEQERKDREKAKALDDKRAEKQAALDRIRKHEQAEVERKRAEKQYRRQRRINIGILTSCLIIGGHFALLQFTTLRFAVLLDGKPLLAGKVMHASLDGEPFAIGNKITPGRHILKIEVPNAAPMQRSFFAFYGSNDLGAIHGQSFKGKLFLRSDPPDAKFHLFGNELDWTGDLPFNLDAVPAGSYRLTVSRKGWEFSQEIVVIRDRVITNKTEFPYGAIEMTSEPSGLICFINGTEVGRTPLTQRELRPGQYTVATTDGEYELTANVTVGPKSSAKHAFAFRYGTTRIESIPTGASVFRNGKQVGDTPVTLRSLADKEFQIELRFADYQSTNLAVRVPENAMSSYAIKLFSKQYLETLHSAQRALEESQLERANNLVAVAIGIEPGDQSAIELSQRISSELAALEQQRLAAERLAAKAAHDALAALALLEPEKIIKSCLAKSDSKFSKLSTVDAAQSNPVAVPVAAATDVIVKGIEVLTFPFQKSEKKPRFDQAQFVHDYGDRFYRYYGIIKSIDVTNSSVVFVPGGTSKQSYSVLACVSDASAFAILKPGSPIWVSGKLKNLDEMVAASPYANRLTLMGCTFFPPETLPIKK